MNSRELADIRGRLSRVTGAAWTLADESGSPVIKVTHRDGHDQILRLQRGSLGAPRADVEFVAHAPSDVSKLLTALEKASPMGDAELREIDERIAGASPAPWRVFLRSDGGLAGPDVIVVSWDEAEDDLYLTLDGKPAPSHDYEFVGDVRQDLPRLVAEVRSIRA